jgi:hypothetical protein
MRATPVHQRADATPCSDQKCWCGRRKLAQPLREHRGSFRAQRSSYSSRMPSRLLLSSLAICLGLGGCGGGSEEPAGSSGGTDASIEGGAAGTGGGGGGGGHGGGGDGGGGDGGAGGTNEDAGGAGTGGGSGGFAGAASARHAYVRRTTITAGLHPAPATWTGQLVSRAEPFPPLANLPYGRCHARLFARRTAPHPPGSSSKRMPRAAWSSARASTSTSAGLNAKAGVGVRAGLPRWSRPRPSAPSAWIEPGASPPPKRAPGANSFCHLSRKRLEGVTSKGRAVERRVLRMRATSPASTRCATDFRRSWG